MRLLLSVTAAAALSALLPAFAAARPAPVTWCGHDETSANRVPDMAIGKQIRFVYAVPADGTDRFGDVASGIATDAAAIDAWWRGQDPSRTPRFDRYPFPGCAPGWGQLDIGFVRLPHTKAEYASAPSTYTSVEADLSTAFPDDQKTVLYYDGPTNDFICGRSPVSAFYGGQYGISIVYLQGDGNCLIFPVGDGSSAEVAAHELLHSLGAVPPEAPHLCAGAHACDSDTDIMVETLNYASTLDVVTLDYGRDDYYGHGGAWWDVQDSDWLARLPERTLTVAPASHGAAIVRVNDVPVPCAGGCTVTVDDGADVSIAAAADDGWKLGSWGGSCSGNDDTCSTAATSDISATLAFVAQPVVAIVRVTGHGRVTSTPAGLSCTGSCRRSFDAVQVTLRAVPARGWRFAGWHGACTGRTCTVVAESPAAKATFVRVR